MKRKNNTIPPSAISALLLKYCAKSTLTQKEIAQQAQITASALCRILHYPGREQLFKTIIALARVLEIPPQELWDAAVAAD